MKNVTNASSLPWVVLLRSDKKARSLNEHYINEGWVEITDLKSAAVLLTRYNTKILYILVAQGTANLPKIKVWASKKSSWSSFSKSNYGFDQVKSLIFFSDRHLRSLAVLHPLEQQGCTVSQLKVLKILNSIVYSQEHNITLKVYHPHSKYPYSYSAYLVNIPFLWS